MAVTNSPPTEWRVIDFSSGDVDLTSAAFPRPVRVLRVATAQADIGGTLVVACRDATANTTFTLYAPVEYIPGEFVTVVQTGTTAGVEVAAGF